MSIRKLTTSSITNNRWYKTMVADNNYPGKNDASFNLNDTLTTFNGSVYAVEFQSDGKILVGGFFSHYGNIPVNNLVRLNSDFTFDFSFNPGTGSNNVVRTICILHDGNIMIGGDFTTFNGSTRNRLALLDGNGALLGTAFTGSAANSSVYRIKKIPSVDQYVIVGNFSSYAGISSAQRAMIVNSSGAYLNNAFNNTATKFDSLVYDVTFQSSGRMIFFGIFSTFNGSSYNKVAAATVAGGIDTTFTVGTGLSEAFSSTSFNYIATQSNDKILIAIPTSSGSITYNGTSVGKLIRLNSDGTLDTSFPNSAITGSSFASNVCVLSNDKIVATGWFSSFSGTTRENIVGLNSDGTIDSAFDIGTGLRRRSGFVPNFLVTVRDSNNRIFISGDFIGYKSIQQKNFLVINTSGATVFPANGVGGFSQFARVARVQSDGKILFGGYIPSYNNEVLITDSFSGVVVRTNANGSRDTSFALTVLNSAVWSIDIQSDGKIIVAGSFDSPRSFILRLNTNGTLDTSFSSQSVNNVIYEVKVLPDNKILIAGEFTTVSGSSRNRIARLNSDGTLDTTFNPGTGANAGIFCMRLQSDGKIIIGGSSSLTNFNGNSIGRICRLNTDGSFDSTFNTGGSGYPTEIGFNSMAIDSNNKIYITGTGATFNGTTVRRLFRLNSDGTLDSTFVPPSSGLFGPSGALIIQPDNKLIIFGSNIQSYGSAQLRGIARINTDGSLDSGFAGEFALGNFLSWNGDTPLYGLNYDNNSIILTGPFYIYNNTVRNGIAKVLI